MANSSRNPETKPRLGRGLAALLGDTQPGTGASELSTGVKQVPIEFIRSNSRNPRQNFDEAELEDLASSIRERGVIQPIIVRAVAGAEDTYEVVAGERRWRAAQRAGRHDIPVIVMQITDRDALEISIVENVQRTNLNALEEARAYALLSSEYGYNHTDLGRVVGKSRSHITNTLRLLALPEHTKELLVSGGLTAGHARALLAVSDPNEVADQILSRGLTVRDVEKLGQSGHSPNAKATQSVPNEPNTQDLIARLALALGTGIKLHQSKRSKELRIQFDNFEQLEYICAKLL